MMAQRDEATSLNDSTSEWQGKIHTQACLTLSPQLPKKPEKLGPLVFRGIPLWMSLPAEPGTYSEPLWAWPLLTRSFHSPSPP